MAARLINDVLDDKVLTRKGSSGSAVTTHNTDTGAASVAKNPDELHYLPKGRMEALHEYEQRIRMTPWLPETKKVFVNRQGALFSTPPIIEGASKNSFKAFEDDFTGTGKTLLWASVYVSEQFQRNGFCGLFVDRATLPEDVVARNGEVSESEKKTRNLGAPRVVVYSAEQILKFMHDEKGLSWVKVLETSTEQATWRDEPRNVQTVRIIDRFSTTSFKITGEKDEDVEALGSVPHSISNVCPFVIAHAFSRRGEFLGNPSLAGPSQCDVTATRLLSDLLWTLFLLGNPILTFRTDKSDDQMNTVQLGAGRYVRLENGKGIGEPEEMAFVQLDAQGIELMIAMYERFIAKAQELGAKQDSASVQVPAEMSGVSRAWKFKTGEERELFVITRQLSEAFNQVLKIVAKMLNVEDSSAHIKFNETFDLETPKEQLEVSNDILKTAEAKKLITPFKVALRRIVKTLPNMTEEDIKKAEQEIEALTLEQNNTLEINGAVAQGIIALVAAKYMTVEEGREKLGLPKDIPTTKITVFAPAPEDDNTNTGFNRGF